MSTFLDILADKNILNRYQIDTVLEQARKDEISIDEVLEGMEINEETIARAKAEHFGVPFRAVNFGDVSFDVMKYIPEDAAHHYQFAPLGRTPDGILEVAMMDPGSVEAQNALQFIASKNNIPYAKFITTRSDFEGILSNYRGLGSEVDTMSSNQQESVNLDDDIGSDASDIIESTAPDTNNEDNKDFHVDVASDVGEHAVGNNTNPAKIVEDAPVTKTVAVILRHAVEGGASDVHVEHVGDKVKVRFRVDGSLYTSLMLPKDIHSALIARIKILARLKLDEKRKPQDGRFFAKIDGRKVDFRVSTMPTFFGEKAVLRILDPEKGVKKLDETGMRDNHIDIVTRALARPYGMILITGPTGSGKTTTLYSMLASLDKEERNVVSLEDPIEYNIAGMNQSQVRPEIGYTFANGLRSILRQDPDVIMVGEIRDKETAQLAIQAALTGHLVFATLHTNNSVGAVPRLVDMGVDPYLIAPTLNLIIAQRLTKRLCGQGKSRPIEAGVAEIIQHEINDLSPEMQQQFDMTGSVYDPEPSSECSSGMKGRMAVFEMFEVTDEVERLILSGASENDLYDVARKKGFLTMKEDAILKAMNGDIPFNEVNTL